MFFSILECSSFSLHFRSYSMLKSESLTPDITNYVYPKSLYVLESVEFIVFNDLVRKFTSSISIHSSKNWYK